MYVQSLKLLARDCEFKAVTADTYSNEAIRDSLIAGLASPIIHQRMLEKESLSLNEAVNLARSLDVAQRNAEKYMLPATPPNLTAASTETTAPTTETCAASYLGGSGIPGLAAQPEMWSVVRVVRLVTLPKYVELAGL